MAIAEILDYAQSKAAGEYLFTMKDGETFKAELFQRRVWGKAMKVSGIKYRKPYSTRHTFCVWALTIGMNPMKLVNLMGHSSKQMVYQVYGEYVENLEDDVENIINYFGNDFLVKPAKKKDPNAILWGQFGVSQHKIQIKY